MIVFDLVCRNHGHRFEGWFASSQDFARQQQRGLVCCPQCESQDIIKAPMAPRLNRKGNQQVAPQTAPASVQAPVPPSAPESMAAPAAPALPPELREKLHAAMTALAKAQAEAIQSSRWVGKNFAEDARAMHYGDKEPAPIHGQASPQEARALVEEGVDIMPLLIPVAAPEEIN